MSETAPPPPPAPTPGDNRPAINAEWLTHMLMEKQAFLHRLFEVFLAEEPKRLGMLCAAVDNRDLRQVLFWAHSLKGAAATMGMERLRDACRDLEFAARDANENALSAQLETVVQEMALVFAVIQETLPNG